MLHGENKMENRLEELREEYALELAHTFVHKAGDIITDLEMNENQVFFSLAWLIHCTIGAYCKEGMRETFVDILKKTVLSFEEIKNENK